MATTGFSTLFRSSADSGNNNNNVNEKRLDATGGSSSGSIGSDRGSLKKGERVLGEFIVGRTLGEGMSSKVKSGRHFRTGQMVALKIMDPDVFRSKEVQQELEILRYFGEPQNRHPNVSGLVTVLHDEEFCSKHGAKSSYESRRVSVIVTEYMDGGDLFSYLSSGIPFNEETARAVLQQVVRGLSHMHKHGVVHLDLKPENILLGRNGIVKIADFGLSEIVKPLRRRGSGKGKHLHKKHSSKARRRSSHLGQPQSGSAGSALIQSLHSLQGRRPPQLQKQGIRTVASLNSLESATSSTSLDSSPPNSPLVHFFPPSSHGAVASGAGRPASLSLSSQQGEDAGALAGPEDDHELFAAISTGRTRSPAATSGAGSGSGPSAATAATTVDGVPLAESGGGIRASASMSNLSTLGGGMGNKSSSYNSISSLESLGSFNSRESRESGSAARFKTPQLVVSSRSGTVSYQAPEVAKGNYDGSKADVYSLGVVLHVMLYGVLPFEEGEWVHRRDFYERVGREALAKHNNNNNKDKKTDVEDDLQHEDNDNDDDARSASSSSSGGSRTDPDDEATLVDWTEPSLLAKDVVISEDAKDLLSAMLRLAPEPRFSLKDAMRHSWVDAARVRGSVQKVAGVVKRREPYVKENRKNQTYMRKARKRNYGPSMGPDLFE